MKNTKKTKAITQRLRAEERSRESEKKFRNLVENLPIGIAISTAEGKIVEMNAKGKQLFGYSSLELKKLPASVLYFDPKDRERFIAELLEKGRISDFEAKFKRKDGSVFWSSVTTVVQKIDGTTQLLSMFMDITERRKMQEALEAKMHDMEVLLDAAVGREEKMMELKEKISQLEEKLK